MTSRKTTEDQASGPETPFGAAQHLFTQPQQMWSAWARIAREQLSGIETLSAELAKLGAQGKTRIDEATDEMAKLVKSSVQYAVGLGETWRTMGLSQARRTIDLLTPEG